MKTVQFLAGVRRGIVTLINHRTNETIVLSAYCCYLVLLLIWIGDLAFLFHDCFFALDPLLVWICAGVFLCGTKATDCDGLPLRTLTL